MRLLVVGQRVARWRGIGGWGRTTRAGVEVPGVEARRLDVTDRAAVCELVARVRLDVVVGTPIGTASGR
ncbi:hypothetical protein ABT346_11965 [Micromonospora peucetia]|uniref:hypothetical protein n=1 Tax=Micromonospora peucetia TaxID=47871 RepID=UPI00331A05A6